MDVLLIVSNVQQVPPDQLAASQEETDSSNRFVHILGYLDQLKVRVTACSLSLWCTCRILEIVDDVLNVVEVAPEKPFEFAAPDFGVRVEEPPEDLDAEKLFAPDLGALLSQVMTSTAASMQMEEMPEVPSAAISLSSTLLRGDNGTRRLISISVFVRDSLFQERASMTMDNRTREIVRSIVVDLSLRSGGKVISIAAPPNSNVVRPRFTKTMVSCYK